MSKKGKSQNVESQLYQSLLPGWRGRGIPDGYSIGDEGEQRGKETPPRLDEQKAYLLLIPVIVEPVSDGSEGDNYQVYIPSNVDILVSGYSKAGKKGLAPVVKVPSTQSRGKHKISMVYGIQQEGVHSLSPLAASDAIRDASLLYSRVLGQVDTALQRTIFKQAEQAANDDKGQRDKGAQTPQDLGTTKKRGGSSKIRHKVRTEALPENSPHVVEDDRKILGNGHTDGKDRLQQVDGDAFEGTGLEGISLEF